MRKRTWITIVLFLLLSLTLNLVRPWLAEAQAATGPLAATNVTKINAAGTKLIDSATGQPFFLMGVNYVGHTDRAWLMWNSDKFDPNLISQDFQQVVAAGLNTVRIFVMKPLRDDINANNFSKLDQVFSIAASNKLRVLLSFNDYDEPDLVKEAQLDKKIAARYSTNPVLLAYDLKNEPQFNDLVGAIYPANAKAPLQTDDFIKMYGEQMSQAQVDAWRQTAEGKQVVPARLDAHAGYIFANAYKLFLKFLDESSIWVAANSGKNTLDYIDSSASAKWRNYLDALNGTLNTWIDSRVAPIREVDTATLITIGWSNHILAKLQANSRLGFVSLHRFPPEGYTGLLTTMNLLNNLHTTFANHPIILEEFGYSNARSDNSFVATNVTASYETALWLFLVSKGFAGGLKWMLVNFPPGYNKMQNNYGLLDDNSQPKPVFYATQAVSNFIQSEGQQPVGTLTDLQPADINVTYQYKGTHGVFSSAANLQNGPIRFTQPQVSPFAAYWSGDNLGQVHILATQPTNLTLDIDALYPQRNPTGVVKLVADGSNTVQALNTSGGTVTFKVNPAQAYTLNIPVQPPAFKKTAPLGGSSRYFPQTQHNLSGAFLNYWEQHGGLAIYGYPISEEFNEGGYTVQYFERNRFEYHPENKGSPSEVLLGLLGRTVTTGRNDEASFQPIAAFASSNSRLYFDATKHSLSFGFKIYWEQHGGLAQFGYPISEEFSELNPADSKVYTVQYFERARFEYHPEYKGTPYETLLGLLGWQVVKDKGWLS